MLRLNRVMVKPSDHHVWMLIAVEEVEKAFNGHVEVAQDH